MIGRAYRFHGHGSLNYVYQHGKTIRGATLSLRYCQNNRRKDWRLAVVVSKKVNKSAVARNRIRRRIYELARLHAAEIAQPYDLVITVFNDEVADLPVAELEKRVLELLKRAHVIIETKESTDV